MDSESKGEKHLKRVVLFVHKTVDVISIVDFFPDTKSYSEFHELQCFKTSIPSVLLLL